MKRPWGKITIQIKSPSNPPLTKRGILSSGVNPPLAGREISIDIGNLLTLKSIHPPADFLKTLRVVNKRQIGLTIRMVKIQRLGQSP